MMAHYAFLNENNVVTDVIAGVDENVTQIDMDGTEIGGSTEAWETFYGNQRNQLCKRTSVSSRKGKKINLETNQATEETGFRKNYASAGYTYNAQIDGFVPPKLHDSFTLNEETGMWVAPTPMPAAEGKTYAWNESTTSWDETTVPMPVVEGKTYVWNEQLIIWLEQE